MHKTGLVAEGKWSESVRYNEERQVCDTSALRGFNRLRDQRKPHYGVVMIGGKSLVEFIRTHDGKRSAVNVGEILIVVFLENLPSDTFMSVIYAYKFDKLIIDQLLQTSMKFYCRLMMQIVPNQR